MRFVELEDRGGVALVTVAREPANALNPALLADGLEALQILAAEPPRAVVLTGSGRFFCSGADLREVPALPAEEQAEMARGVNRLFAGWHGLARPLVCAVNGHAIAGGLILALCGDYRVVGGSGQFGLTEVKVGIPYPSVAMTVVQAELSPPVARRLVLRGELFDAATAHELGVFDEIVADDAVLARALEVAARDGRAAAGDLRAREAPAAGRAVTRARHVRGRGGDRMGHRRGRGGGSGGTRGRAGCQHHGMIRAGRILA